MTGYPNNGWWKLPRDSMTRAEARRLRRDRLDGELSAEAEAEARDCTRACPDCPGPELGCGAVDCGGEG